MPRKFDVDELAKRIDAKHAAQQQDGTTNNTSPKSKVYKFDVDELAKRIDAKHAAQQQDGIKDTLQGWTYGPVYDDNGQEVDMSQAVKMPPADDTSQMTENYTPLSEEQVRKNIYEYNAGLQRQQFDRMGGQLSDISTARQAAGNNLAEKTVLDISGTTLPSAGMPTIDQRVATARRGREWAQLDTETQDLAQTLSAAGTMSMNDMQQRLSDDYHGYISLTVPRQPTNKWQQIDFTGRQYTIDQINSYRQEKGLPLREADIKTSVKPDAQYAIDRIVDNYRDYLPTNADGSVTINGKTYSPAAAQNIVRSMAESAVHDERFMSDPDYRQQYIRNTYDMSEDAFIEQQTAILDKKIEEIERLADKALNDDIEFKSMDDVAWWQGSYVIANNEAQAGKAMASWASGTKATTRKLRQRFASMKDNGFWSGLDEGFDLANVLTLGFNTLGNEYAEGKALQKAYNGEPLTDEERVYVLANEVLQQMEELQQIKGGRSWWNQVGEGLGQSGEFMAQMAATGGLGSISTAGVKGLGIGAARQAIKGSFKQSIGQGLKTAVGQTLKVGGRSLKNIGITELEGLARAPFMGGTWAQLADKRNQQYHWQDGKLVYTPTSAWKDVYSTLLGQMHEVSSEAWGSWINSALGGLGRGLGINKFMSKIGLGSGNKVLGWQKSAAWRDMERRIGYAGAIAEPISEALGDVATNIAMMPFGDNDGWKEMGTSDYWTVLLATCAMQSAYMQLPTVPARISRARQINKIDKDRNVALNNIQSLPLRNTLLSISELETPAEIGEALAGIDWNDHSRPDVGYAMDYIMNDTKLRISRGEDNETQRMQQFMPHLMSTASMTYKGANPNVRIPEMKLVFAVTEDENGQARKYTVDSGDLANPDALINVYDPTTGEKTSIIRSKISETMTVSLSDKLAEDYAMMFSSSIEADKLRGLLTSIDAMRADSSHDIDTAIKSAIENAGYKVYQNEDIVTLSDGEQAMILGDFQDGHYMISREDGSVSMVGFMDILQPDIATAKAQTEIIQEQDAGQQDNAVEQSQSSASTDIYAQNTTEEDDDWSERTGLHLGDLVMTPDGVARIIERIPNGGVWVDQNIGNINNDPMHRALGQYALDEMRIATAEEIASARPQWWLPETEQSNTNGEGDMDADGDLSTIDVNSNEANGQNVATQSLTEEKDIPLTQDGDIDYETIDDPQLFASLLMREMGNQSLASDYIDTLIHSVQQRLDKLQNDKASLSNANELMATYRAISAVQSKIDVYNAVRDILGSNDQPTTIQLTHELGQGEEKTSGDLTSDEKSSTFDIPVTIENNEGNQRYREDRSEHSYDGRRVGADGSRVYSQRTAAVSGVGDGSRIRVLAPSMAASYRDHTVDSERDRRAAESERLVKAAKDNDLFIEENSLASLGKKQPGRTGESVIYIDRTNDKVFKVKDPYAKAAIKRNAPEDAIYEHKVHNILFPDTPYTLEGVSEHLGDVRFVLSQDFVESYTRPTSEQIKHYLSDIGLYKEDEYSYGNDYVSITDIDGDNVIIDQNGKLRFIDPLIRFKRPATEIISTYQQYLENLKSDNDMGIDHVRDNTRMKVRQGETDAIDEVRDHNSTMGNAMADLIRGAGIEVVTDKAEMREILDAVTGNVTSAENAAVDRMQEIEQINNEYNETIDGLTEDNADGIALYLGTPSAEMLSAGMPNQPIKIYGNKIIKKAKKHRYDISQIKDLPKAINNAIALFKGTHNGSFVVLTELSIDGNNVVAAIRTNKNGEANINFVSSVYGKHRNGIVSWINNEKLLRIDSKEKLLDLISAPTPIAGATSNQGDSNSGIMTDVDTITKIVQNFENPNIGLRFQREPLNSLQESMGRMQHQRAQELIEELTSEGYEDFSGPITSYSQWGVSTYVYATKDGKRDKFRISDHPKANDKRSREIDVPLRNPQITYDNFYQHTEAIFEEVSRPQRDPDYKSTTISGYGISSEYWYGSDEGGDYVVRGSDHWSNVSPNIASYEAWRNGLRDKSEYRYSNQYYNPNIGTCLWSLISKPDARMPIDWHWSRGEDGFTKVPGAPKYQPVYGKVYLKDMRRRNYNDENRLVAPRFSITAYHGSAADVTEENPRIVDNIRYMHTPQGEVYGFTYNGRIYLDPDLMNPNTPIHEFTELWCQIVAQEKPELWARAKELARQTDVWSEVIADPNYADISEDAQASETWARISAAIMEDRTADITADAGLLSKIKDFFRAIWSTLKNTFGQWSQNDLKSLTAEQFAQMPLRDLIEGIDISGYVEAMHSNETDSRESKTLVGIHNISQDKLIKALKQGGLANPSIAVIDVDKQTHLNYGDISLLMPAAQIDKSTGHNAGTWLADAYTPRYPQVERKIGQKGEVVLMQDLQSLPNEMYSDTSMAINNWLDNGDSKGLAYMYLFQIGKAPQLVKINPIYSKSTHEVVNNVTNGRFNLFNLSNEAIEGIVNVYISEIFGGDREAYQQALQEKIGRLKNNADNAERALVRSRAAQKLDLIEKHGFDYSALSEFVRGVRDDMRKSGTINSRMTNNIAYEYIVNNNLVPEFDDWVRQLDDRYAIEEVIFVGYTPVGYRKYVANTINNASKIMREQGRNAATGLGINFEHFIAGLLNTRSNLNDIRSEKARLVSNYADVDKFKEKWLPVFLDLGEKLQPDAQGYDDYGLYRLAEAAQQSDPQSYIKKEYGIELSETDVRRFNDMISAIKDEYPAMYFETKFERPVYLNEFAGAVVPNTTNKDILQTLHDAGIPYRTYTNQEERSQIVRAFSRELGDVRFHVSGNNTRFSYGNTDAWREANDMEQRGFDAQTIFDKTGWRRENGSWVHHQNQAKSNHTFDLRYVRWGITSRSQAIKKRISKSYNTQIADSKARIREIDRAWRSAWGDKKTNSAKVSFILKDNTVESLPLEDIVLADIAQGQKLVWRDSPDGKKRGLSSELGLSNAKTEGMSSVTAGATEYLEDYVQSISERINGYERDINDQDIRNAVIEIFGSYPSAKSALAELARRYQPRAEIEQIEDGIYRLEVSRDNELVAEDNKLVIQLAEFEANPEPFINDWENAASQSDEVNALKYEIADMRKRLAGYESRLRTTAFNRAVDKEMFAAVTEMKRAIKDLITSQNVEYFRKRDMRKLIDMVDAAKTLSAVGNVMQELRNVVQDVSVRIAEKERDSLLKLRISEDMTPAEFVAGMVRNGSLTRTDAERLLNDRWRGVNKHGVSVAKWVDNRTRMTLEEIRANVNSSFIKIDDERKTIESEMQTAEVTGGKITPSMQSRMDSMYALEDYSRANDVMGQINELHKQMQEFIDTMKDAQLETKALQENTADYDPRLAAAYDREYANARDAYNAAEKEISDLYDIYLMHIQAGNDKVKTLLIDGRVALSAWRQKDKEHGIEVVRDVFNDLDNYEDVYDHKKDLTKLDKAKKFARFTLAASHWTMDQTLREIGHHAPQGEGYTWERFAPALTSAADNMVENITDRGQEINEKLRSIWGDKKINLTKLSEEAEKHQVGVFTSVSKGSKIHNQLRLSGEDGKRIIDMWSRNDARKMLESEGWREEDIQTLREAKVEEIPISAAQAMYLIATWNQNEGKVKMAKQGFTEQQMTDMMQKLTNLDSRYEAFMRWVIDEFLPSTRETYNQTHVEVFGTSMTEVNNYFPIKVLDTKLQQNVELGKGSANAPMPSTVVGSIINRTHNTKPIDIKQNFFKVFAEHVQTMEHWNAFTPVIKDIQTALSNTTLRNMMEAYMPGLHEAFKTTSAIATDSYSPTKTKYDMALIGISKMWAGSKIAFRINTALKQLTSLPVFRGYTADPRFHVEMSKQFLHVLGPDNNIKWCIENLPSFRKRWESRFAGNEQLARLLNENSTRIGEGSNWLQKFIDKAAEIGFTPNAAVDGFTVSIGARAVYAYEYKRLLKELQKPFGKNITDEQKNETERQAHERAVFCAEMFFNQTQQSSEGLHMSQLQSDRTLTSVALSTFNNSTFAAGRIGVMSIKELFRNSKKEKQSVKNRESKRIYEALVRSGMTETEAKVEADKQASKIATQRVRQAKTTAIARLVFTGYGMQFFYRVGGSLWAYAFGDDDEEKMDRLKDDLIYGVLFAPVTWVPLGSSALSALEGHEFETFGALSETFEDATKAIKHVKNMIDGEAGFGLAEVYSILDFAARNGIGLDLESATNILIGIESMFEHGWSTEAVMKILNAPESQIQLIAGRRRDDETAMQYVNRLAYFNSLLTSPVPAEELFNEDGKFTGELKLGTMDPSKKQYVKWHNEYRDRYFNDLLNKYATKELRRDMSDVNKEYAKIIKSLGWSADKYPTDRKAFDDNYNFILPMNEDVYYDLFNIANDIANAIYDRDRFIGEPENCYRKIEEVYKLKKKLIEVHNGTK